MRTVVYNLFSNSIVTGVAFGALQVVREGRIRGVAITCNGVGGAGTGFYAVHAMFQAATENPGQLGNTPRESNLGGTCATKPNAGAFVAISPFIPANVPCRVGDTMSIAIADTGVPPTGASAKVMIVVEES